MSFPVGDLQEEGEWNTLEPPPLLQRTLCRTDTDGFPSAFTLGCPDPLPALLMAWVAYVVGA